MIDVSDVVNNHKLTVQEFDEKVGKIIEWQDALETVKYAIQQGNMAQSGGFFSGRSNYQNIYELSSINKSLAFYHKLLGKRKIPQHIRKHARNKVEQLKKRANIIERRLTDFNAKHKVKISLPAHILNELYKL